MGVCYFYTQIERNSAYLLSFNPTKAKDTNLKINKILNDLYFASKKVEINGFKNLKEFSAVYQDEIQESMNNITARGNLKTIGLFFNRLSDGIYKYKNNLRTFNKLVKNLKKSKFAQNVYIHEKGNINLIHAWSILKIDDYLDDKENRKCHQIIYNDSNYLSVLKKKVFCPNTNKIYEIKPDWTIGHKLEETDLFWDYAKNNKRQFKRIEKVCQ
jgi:hypothetical protein